MFQLGLLFMEFVEGSSTLIIPALHCQRCCKRIFECYAVRTVKVLCYEGSASAPQGKNWGMDRLTAIRNFFRRWFCRNKEVAAAAGHNADHAESAAGGAASHVNTVTKHDEQLGDHKDPNDDFQNQVARPAQLKSPFTHSLKCGHF
nr:uncharacterized protein LOC126542875 isoform X1 [Dermacentor andersoni]